MKGSAIRTLALLALIPAREAGLVLAQSTSGEQHVGITSAGTIGTYEGRYGKPQWVSLDTIARGEAPLSGALRTSGTLQVERADRFDHSSPMTYALVSPDGMDRKRAKLFVCPVPGIERSFTSEAESLRFRDVEVVGTPDPQAGDACHVGSASFVFWSYTVVEPKPPAVDRGGNVTPIGSILEEPDRFHGAVRVVGQFRGRNLFGDVPAAEVPAEGWLIKDSGALLWIVGHEPKGKGFALDPLSQADGKWWVQVTGTPETREGRVVFRAREILALSHAPHS